jgi:outer membrane lipoprotein SlyB
MPPLKPRLSFSRAAALASVSALAAVSLAACAEDYGPGRYDRFEAGVPARVEQGTVVDSRPITLGPHGSGGAVVGGLTGGAIGAQFGGRGVDHATFGIAGAVLGALAGNAIEKNNQAQGFAYIIKFRDGSTAEIPQVDPAPIPNGTRVFVSYGDRVRVRPAGPGEELPMPRRYRDRDAYGPPPPPPPPPGRY